MSNEGRRSFFLRRSTMGTGAVSCKSAATGFQVDPVSAGSIHCDNCHAQFSIFKKRRFCTTCRRCFCSSCLAKESAASKSRPTAIHTTATNGITTTTTTTMATRNCHSCALMISGQFDRNELMKLKISDLKFFLVAKQISTENIKEKQHLVELVVVHFGPNHLRHQEQERHEQFVEELRRQLFVDGVPTARAFEDNRIINGVNHDSGDDGIGNSEDDADQEHDTGNTNVTPTQEARPSRAPSARQQEHTENNSNRPSTPVTSDQPDPATGNPVGRTPADPLIALDDLKLETDIDQLTIRQLKRLLATNFVSYKGCCERHEIVDKVKHLYLDHVRQRELAERLFSEEDARSNGTKPPAAPTAGAAPSDDAYLNSPDAQLCKICMEAIMDCVLLECGHMATCTSCGKRLSECPICRQYVIRAVRVFRV